MGFWNKFRKKSSKITLAPEIQIHSEYGAKLEEPEINLPEPIGKWAKFKQQQEKFNEASNRQSNLHTLPKDFQKQHYKIDSGILTKGEKDSHTEYSCNYCTFLCQSEQDMINHVIKKHKEWLK